MRSFFTPLLVVLILMCYSVSTAQNYKPMLSSLKKLDSTLQLIKQYYEKNGTTPKQYVDADGFVSESELNRSVLYDLALDFERVANDLSMVMTDAQKADASRPKFPAGAGHGSVVVTGYLHQQYYNKTGVSESSMFVSKRARLAIKGKLNNYASVKLMGEFASSPKLLDGALTIAPNKSWSMTFGQYKPPFGTEFLTAASNWAFVNTASMKSLGTDRDIGTHLTYKEKLNSNLNIALMAGVFNGSGYNNTDANSDKNFVGRAELTISKAVTLAPNVYVGKSNDTGSAIEDINSYGSSIAYKKGNEVLVGEYMHSKVGDTKAAGWYVWGGHTFKTNSNFLPAVQLVARYDQVDKNLDVDNNATDRITIGTNLFIDGKYTKLQLNYQINGEEGTSVDNNEFLLNFQVAF